MKLQRIFAAAAVVLGLSLATTVIAGNHADYVGNGPFKNGPEVTKKCMECHEAETKAFMKSVHWTWSREQVVNGKKVELGKKNALNNFCIGLPGNWPRCTSCHAGYGWKDGTFDFSKAENVDCLVCHDTTGTYKKFPAGAGHPAYPGEDKKFGGKPWPAVDLVKVAQSVGKPTRAACGSCHFYGGGGDHVKHGDLDSSLTNPAADIDVHMGGKAKLVCQSCHKGGKDHALKGEALSVSVGTGKRILGCTDCHKATVHANAMLNKHAKSVACQTCHIPTISRGQATKVGWWWSDVGRKDIDPDGEEFDKETFAKKKGTFKWNMNYVPTYAWYNGKIERYMVGDKIADPSKLVVMTKPVGDIRDRTAKIYPYKFYEGSQPMDAKFKYLNTFQQYKSLWEHYDWDKALKDGGQDLGLPYSGKFQFVKTVAWLSAPHEVAPKEQALQCGECHMGAKRMDWKALGYKGDPMQVGGRVIKVGKK